jgi:malonate-semialdehyde dehydrogenase (acetylating)/methylmalonate-semialdehyde dehydrogenase
VGDSSRRFTEAIVDIASTLKVGNGLQDGVQMGPVISDVSKARIEGLIGRGLQQGAKAILDGRSPTIEGGDRGSFLKPTILTGIGPDSELTRTEIFGPVLALQQAGDLDLALAILSSSAYGNQASIFTSSGAHARRFRYEAPAGNIGVNIGVAAPMAYFPFSGWKDSFLGVLHGQGSDGVEFYTEKKVVVERWPNEWSRKF